MDKQQMDTDKLSQIKEIFVRVDTSAGYDTAQRQQLIAVPNG